MGKGTSTGVTVKASGDTRNSRTQCRKQHLGVTQGATCSLKNTDSSFCTGYFPDEGKRCSPPQTAWSGCHRPNNGSQSRGRNHSGERRWGLGCAKWCRAAAHPHTLLWDPSAPGVFLGSGRKTSALLMLQQSCKARSRDVAPRRKHFPLCP